MTSSSNVTSIHHFLYDKKLHKIILFVFALGLYANTLGHDFVLDDGIVITENKFVKKGISGISDLLSKDSFYGFFKKEGKEKLVAGGRYRPMSMILFSMVYELVEESPMIFHLFSIIMYGLLGIILYILLKHLFNPLLSERSTPFAFFASLLFVAHPVHTECVANIKGMDEICALLFSLLSFYFCLLYIDTKRLTYLLLTGMVFLIGLLSKENAIAYLGIIPIGLYLIYFKEIKTISKIGGILFVATLVFIFMRAEILGFNPFNDLSKELMNNPFMKLEQGVNLPMNFSEKAGVISFSLFEYLRLLIIPHPLTHDYYPKQIPVLGILSIKSILAFLLYGSMILFACFRFKNNPVICFSIVSFLLPLFLVSNILFPIGTNMGERFLFMPSVGFCVMIAYWLTTFYSLKVEKALFVIGLITLLYSLKTITRNPAWHDNMTLFSTDIKTSKNSAKIHNGIAGVMLEAVPVLKDSLEIFKITSKARKELEKAIAIHPIYMEAHLQLGNVNFFEKNYEQAIKKYNFVLEHLSEDEDAFKNLQMALRERGRQIAMQTGNVPLAKDYLRQSLGMNPQDAEAMMLMGIAEGSSGNYKEAAMYFYRTLSSEPKNAQAYFNLGITFKNSGEAFRSDSMFKQAALLDPQIYEKNGMKTQ